MLSAVLVYQNFIEYYQVPLVQTSETQHVVIGGFDVDGDIAQLVMADGSIQEVNLYSSSIKGLT